MKSQDRRTLEGGRVDPKCRNNGSVKKILGEWLFKKETVQNEKGELPNDPELEVSNAEVYREYFILWGWLSDRAKADGKDLFRMRSTKGGVRMTLEYVRRIHENLMKDFDPKEFRVQCRVRLDDYLMWQDSEMGKLIFRIEELIENDRLKKQYHIVRDQMEKGIVGGDKKMIETWLKVTAKFAAFTSNSTGYQIQKVDVYPEDEPFYTKLRLKTKEQQEIDDAHIPVAVLNEDDD